MYFVFQVGGPWYLVHFRISGGGVWDFLSWWIHFLLELRMKGSLWHWSKNTSKAKENFIWNIFVFGSRRTTWLHVQSFLIAWRPASLISSSLWHKTRWTRFVCWNWWIRSIVDLPIGISADRFINWSNASRSIDRPIHRPIDRSVVRAVDFCWRTIDQATDRSVWRSSDRSIVQSTIYQSSMYSPTDRPPDRSIRLLPPSPVVQAGRQAG